MRLEASDLAVGYPGRRVAEGISLTLDGGEVLGLLGPNGTGKTTLFRTLLGLQRPLGGTVTVDGEALSALPPAEIARRMAYVPQAHVTEFSYSVLDVVLMGRTARIGSFSAPGARDARIARDRLDSLGIAALADADYTRISGGQRQLVLVARALAQEAPILIMDEPTASLDFGNQALVLERIRDLAAAGYGVLLSTHDPDHVLGVARRAAIMAGGGLAASGATDDVVTGATLSRVYGTEVTVETTPSGQRVCVPAALRARHRHRPDGLSRAPSACG